MACLRTAAIVLAAGSASRMGQAKQVMLYRGKPLAGYAIAAAIGAELGPVIVVAGAEADRLGAALASYPVEIVTNPHWASGMGSSLAAGVRHLQASAGGQAGVAVLLADQPLVTSEHLRGMRRLWLESGGASIVAAEYNGTVGVPAFFRRAMFAALAALDPAAGARALLRNAGSQVIPFPLPEAAFDVDTPDDFAALPT